MPADAIELRWNGPFSFTSRGARPLLCSPEGASQGIYLWIVRTNHGPRVHYVGETGSSFAARHVEHFESYAMAMYSTRDADAFLDGRDIVLFTGRYWRRDLDPAAKLAFIDHFPEYASHVLRCIEAIDLYVADLVGDQRLRRRVEGGLIAALYSSQELHRGMFSSGFRVWKRRQTEVPLVVRMKDAPAVSGMPRSFEA